MKALREAKGSWGKARPTQTMGIHSFRFPAQKRQPVPFGFVRLLMCATLRTNA